MKQAPQATARTKTSLTGRKSTTPKFDESDEDDFAPLPEKKTIPKNFVESSSSEDETPVVTSKPEKVTPQKRGRPKKEPNSAKKKKVDALQSSDEDEDDSKGPNPICWDFGASRYCITGRNVCTGNTIFIGEIDDDGSVSLKDMTNIEAKDIQRDITISHIKQRLPFLLGATEKFVIRKGGEPVEASGEEIIDIFKAAVAYIMEDNDFKTVHPKQLYLCSHPNNYSMIQVRKYQELWKDAIGSYWKSLKQPWKGNVVVYSEASSALFGHVVREQSLDNAEIAIVDQGDSTTNIAVVTIRSGKIEIGEWGMLSGAGRYTRILEEMVLSYVRDQLKKENKNLSQSQNEEIRAVILRRGKEFKNQLLGKEQDVVEKNREKYLSFKISSAEYKQKTSEMDTKVVEFINNSIPDRKKYKSVLLTGGGCNNKQLTSVIQTRCFPHLKSANFIKKTDGQVVADGLLVRHTQKTEIHELSPNSFVFMLMGIPNSGTEAYLYQILPKGMTEGRVTYNDIQVGQLISFEIFELQGDYTGTFPIKYSKDTLKLKLQRIGVVSVPEKVKKNPEFAFRTKYRESRLVVEINGTQGSWASEDVLESPEKLQKTDAADDIKMRRSLQELNMTPMGWAEVVKELRNIYK